MARARSSTVSLSKTINELWRRHSNPHPALRATLSRRERDSLRELGTGSTTLCARVLLNNFRLGYQMLTAILFVMLGGAFGSASRYVITHFSSDLSHHHGFPYGTLLVNVLGSLAVGYVLTWSADHTHDRWRLLAATGFCGGFTTFSAFAYETMAYWNSGRLALLGLNIVLNNTLSLCAVLLGISLHNSK